LRDQSEGEGNTRAQVGGEGDEKKSDRNGSRARNGEERVGRTQSNTEYAREKKRESCRNIAIEEMAEGGTERETSVNGLKSRAGNRDPQNFRPLRAIVIKKRKESKRGVVE